MQVRMVDLSDGGEKCGKNVKKRKKWYYTYNN